jgi:diacylglycerol kinase family enzyme
VLVNARAGASRRDPGLPSRLRWRLPEGTVLTTGSPDELDDAVRALYEAGVETLVLVGGDGTVGGTATALLAGWPGPELPSLVLTPGGTVNTIARSLGARGAPERIIERLLDGAPARYDTLRPLVRAQAGDECTRVGMIFANGAAVRWLRLYYEESRRGVAGAISVVARVTASAVTRGELARSLFAPAACEIRVDGEHLAADQFTVMAASSVTHIGLGFRPFHSAGRDPKRFHFSTTSASAGRLCRELPSLRLGRNTHATCLEHYSAARVSLRFDRPQPWSVDADVFPDAIGIELAATRPLRFLVP